ncbi:MAG: hybrid sensor histidine kinase/response regulator [Verrucomicrobiota bacterium]
MNDPDPIPGKVLIVDDEEFNRECLRDPLVARGYLVFEAEDGARGVEMAEEHAPDLILMDLMMPVMDGITACRNLKLNPVTAPIQIIIVTALSERDARLAAIEAGANDFLNKPVDLAEVLLRVRNAVQTKQLYNQLQQSHRKLEELERLRVNLTHMIVHDLRSPITGLIGFLELFRNSACDRLSEHELEFLDHLQNNSTGLAEMVSSILDISRMEAGKMPLQLAACDLSETAAAAIAPLRPLVHERRLTLDITENASAICDREIIRRVIANLIANALKFTPSQGAVTLTIVPRGAFMRIEVSDNGPGIAPADHQHIFQKFGQVKDSTQNTGSGIGLTFCKLAVDTHGGRIGIISDLGKGCTVWLEIPTDPK